MEAQEELRENIKDIWQERWSNSKKAEWTRKIIPNVRRRMEIPLYLNHHITQYLTRHSDFAAKLTKLGLKYSPGCTCGQGEDDAEHSIYHCSRWTTQRENLKEAILSEGEIWPCDPAILTKSRRIYEAFVKFVKTTLTEKSNID